MLKWLKNRRSAKIRKMLAKLPNGFCIQTVWEGEFAWNWSVQTVHPPFIRWTGNAHSKKAASQEAALAAKKIKRNRD